MSNGKWLNKASSVFFFTGFLAAKLQYLPFFLFSAITYIFSLVCYLIGYLLWLGATFLNPDSVKHNNVGRWFPLRTTQHKIAALLGIAATIGLLIALTSPFAAIPAGWLFVSSNVFWSMAEFQKVNAPPQDIDYSPTRQSSYLHYALLMTVISVITALSVTLSMAFPLSGLAILTAAAIASITLGTIALNKWISVNLYVNNPDFLLAESYSQMSKNMPQEAPVTSLAASPEKETTHKNVTTFQPVFTDKDLSQSEEAANLAEDNLLYESFYTRDLSKC